MAMGKKPTFKKQKLQARGLEKEAAALSPFKSTPNENEEIFRMLANVSNDMIHLCTRDGKILYANSATKRLLGYPLRELIGTSSEKLIHPDDLQRVGQDKELLFDEAKPVPAREIRLLRKDATYISVNIVMLLLGSGSKRKYIGTIVRNTTILKTSAIALIATNNKLQQEIEDRKIVEKKILEKKMALQKTGESLAEINVALNVLLKKREKDKVTIEEYVSANIGEMVIPYLEKLMLTDLNAYQKTLADIMLSNLKEVASSFLLKLSSRHFNLSPAEIRVANHIKNGLKTKEIAAFFNISMQTVKNHRHKIREKLGIKNKNINLATYLASID